uniref:Small ribosomal subunit protein uS12m n=1 Tax=Acrobeloides nanus TaxID=290746 RepID=A0A914E351_9BILA
MNRFFSLFTRLSINPIRASTSFASPFLKPTFLNTTLSKPFHATVPQNINNYLQWMRQKGPPKPKLSRRKRNKVSHGTSTTNGTVIKLVIKRPAKPNSGNKKCAYVKLVTGKKVLCYIPGEGHNLQEHSKVAVIGKRKRDIRGCKARIVRGRYDCNLPRSGKMFKKSQRMKKLRAKLSN